MKINVLLIEDDQTLLDEIRDLLGKYFPDARIREARTRSAVTSLVEKALLRGLEYEVIIVDLRVPTPNGDQDTLNDLPSRLRGSFPDASISVFSGNLEEALLHELTSTGDIHIVEKPRIEEMI